MGHRSEDREAPTANDPDSQKQEADRLLGRKALERGWITPEQLAEAVAEQGRGARPRPLGNILAARGALSDERLIQLLEELRSAPLGADDGRPGGFPVPFGKYSLLRELGRGGMGIVYEARDTVLSRRVALKVVLPRPGADAAQIQEDTERFMREARLSANLPRDPYIVGVYDAGAVDGRCYLAMELIEGRSLSKKRAAGAGDLREEVRILRDVCRGVHLAHRHGVIHRDLKPDNILLSEGDQPHVTDFGLAKSLDPETSGSLTAQGRVMGTPRYMSPEQAEGLDTVDSRTDIYSIGVMLYEALAGRPVFAARSVVELLMKIVREAPTPPSSGRPPGSVDPRLEAICLRAIDRDPSRRHASAEALAVDLDGWLTGPATPASPPLPTLVLSPSSGPAPVHRGSRGPFLLAAALLVFFGGAGALVALSTPAERLEWMARVRKLLGRDVPAPPRDPAPPPAPAPPPRDNRDLPARKPKDAVPFRNAAEFVSQHPGPVDAGFVDAVSRLSPEDQASAVMEKFKELNPKYAAKPRHRIEQGKVVEWVSVSSAVTDLSPLRALPDLRALEVPAEWDAPTGRFNRSSLSDLSPLRGMALQRLKIPGTAVRDLSVLRGMPLATLRCDWTEVSDLGPLSGAPLVWLDILGTPVTSLAPLAGTPLEFLNCAGTRISDLSPLRDLPLKGFHARNTKVTDFTPLQKCPLTVLRFDYSSDRDAALLRSMKQLTEINELPAAEFIARFARPWEALFDDTSVAALVLQPSGVWALEKGALTCSWNEATLITREDFEDGEVRIRFRSEGIGSLSLGVRVAGPKGYVVLPDPRELNASKVKVHELLFTGKGDQVTALLDGKEVPFKVHNGPRKGPILIRMSGGGRLALLSLERR